MCTPGDTELDSRFSRLLHSTPNLSRVFLPQPLDIGSLSLDSRLPCFKWQLSRSLTAPQKAYINHGLAYWRIYGNIPGEGTCRSGEKVLESVFSYWDNATGGQKGSQNREGWSSCLCSVDQVGQRMSQSKKNVGQQLFRQSDAWSPMLFEVLCPTLWLSLFSDWLQSTACSADVGNWMNLLWYLPLWSAQAERFPSGAVEKDLDHPCLSHALAHQMF